jgi:hypothetical protein
VRPTAHDRRRVRHVEEALDDASAFLKWSALVPEAPQPGRHAQADLDFACVKIQSKVRRRFGASRSQRSSQTPWSWRVRWSAASSPHLDST